MSTEREVHFLTQALHHLINADTYQSQGIKFLRAFIEKDFEYVDKELIKLGFSNEEDHKEYNKKIEIIYNKMRRQWLDSKSNTVHKEENNCECHLCLLQKLRNCAIK